MSDLYEPNHYAKITEAVVDATPPERVLNALGLDDGNTVIRRVRTKYQDNGTAKHSLIEQSVSWFPTDYGEKAPKLLTTDRIREGTYRYLADALDVRLSKVTHIFETDLATESEADTLGLYHGVSRANLPVTPEIVPGRHLFETDQGRVIEFGESISSNEL